MATWLHTAGVTVWDAIPSVFRSLLGTLEDGTVLAPRLVRLTSEPALRSDFDAFCEHFAPTTVLASVLGSPETGITAQTILTPDDSPTPGRLPVGQPADGIELVLIDTAGDEVPDGQEGQLVVRSRYLSPGYWRDDALTAERFSLAEDGRRELRTGDLARRALDGTLTITGHSDALRGH
jgi:acyl-coenzyme A synthetase/AMP-(fatty) acid ligase